MEAEREPAARRADRRRDRGQGRDRPARPLAHGAGRPGAHLHRHDEVRHAAHRGGARVSAATAAAAAYLTLEDVTVAYDGRPALENVTMSVPHGAQVAIVGPNGAGKSTLFKALVGLLPVRSRHACSCSDREPGEHGDTIAYVPQREEIDWGFPVTVHDVVMMGRYGTPGLVPPARGPPTARWWRAAWTSSASPSSRGAPSASSPAASSSACSSPGRSPRSRTCCCWTSPSRAWTSDAREALLDAPRAPARAGHHRAGQHARHGDGRAALRADRPAEPPADRLRRAGHRVHPRAPQRGLRRPGDLPRRHGRDRPVLPGHVGDGEEHRHDHGPHAEPR